MSEAIAVIRVPSVVDDNVAILQSLRQINVTPASRPVAGTTLIGVSPALSVAQCVVQVLLTPALTGTSWVDTLRRSREDTTRFHVGTWVYSTPGGAILSSSGSTTAAGPPTKGAAPPPASRSFKDDGLYCAGSRIAIAVTCCIS